MTDPATPATGSRRRFMAGERLLLDDLDCMWVVTEGSVEVFAVRAMDGDAIGARHWLFTVATGAAIFAIPPVDDGSLIFVAVAGSDGEIETRDFAAARRDAAASEQARARLAELIDSWLLLAGGTVARSDDAQITDLLTCGRTVALAADRRAGATTNVVWVRHGAGHSWYLGIGGVIALRDSTNAFPLAGGAWVLARTPVELVTCATAEWIRDDPACADFDFYRRILAAWTVTSILRTEAAERNRRLRRAVSNRQMKASALAQLVRTIGSTDAATDGRQSSHSNVLLEACRAIGVREGIEFRAPASWEVEGGVRDPVDAICTASHVRSRRVLLKGDWWLVDSGPILCRRAAGAAPVAALRARDGRYWLHDPVDGSRTAMSAEVAGTLEPIGVVFYRPLPDRPVSTGMLVRFVLSGMTGSLSTIALIALLAGALGLVMPIATGFVFDEVIPSGARGQLAQLFVGLLIAALSAQVFAVVSALATLRLEGRSATAIEAAVFDRLLQLRAPFFQRFTVGDLVSRVGGIGQVRALLSSGTITVLLGGLTCALNFALLFFFAPTLALVAGLFALATGAMLLLMGWRVKRLQDTIQEVSGRLAGFVFEMVSGVAKLRVSGAEDRALAVWARQYAAKVRLERRASQAQGNAAIFGAALPLLASIITFAVVGAMLDSSSPLDLATFVAFSSAMGVMIAAALSTSNTLVGMVQIAPLMKRASAILMEPPEVTSERTSPGRLTGRIEGRNLSFRYKPHEPPVLYDVSFFAEPGEFIAFVGPSGSGKSTTLRLVLGFETPETGAVYFDGQDLATVDVSAVRRQMGVVLQSSRLMAGDVYSNIVGSSMLTMDDAWEAAEMAGFADDVRDMPMKLQTVISEGGSTLSGGQRQRLLIARALVHKPRIILFDEATSALDNRTQRIVSESLDRLRATRIVIAHRLSTIQNADRVYVVDAGRVLECGRPDDLLKQGGVFTRLAARQLA